MAKNLMEIVNRLLKISKEFIDEFGTLAALSSYDRENGKEFDIHINKAKELMDTENIIINNLTYDELVGIVIILSNCNDDSLAYDRICMNIDDRLNEISDMDTLDIEIEDEEINEEVIDEDGIQSYFIEDENSDKYDMDFANYINIFSLKRIRDRIIGTDCDNHSDLCYKEKLLKQIKILKYLVLSQNPKMERIGLNSRFNISKIPYLESPNVDTSIIAYNHCVALIDRMYNPIFSKDEISDTTINLFNMMCFESYLEHVNIEELRKLSNLCSNLREKSKNPFLGDVCYHKILSKDKN